MNKNDYLIVVVEDENDLLELLEYRLSLRGYDVVGFTSTGRVEDILNEEDVKLLILDRTLPGEDTIDFLHKIRKKGHENPAIFLTAKDSQEDILEGLQADADDYVTKPFNMDELLLRVSNLLGRTVNQEKTTLQHKDIIVDLKEKKVNIEGEEIDVTKLEYKLLLFLMNNIDIVLSKEHFVDEVWGEDADIQQLTVTVAIKRLKAKIDPNGVKNYIHSLRGYGYVFK